MCNGLEERLIDCPNRGIEVSSCSHFQDAGVICIAGMVIQVTEDVSYFCSKFDFNAPLIMT